MASEELRGLKADVLAATDLVELIGEYVALKRAGQGYKGLCPFHDEKTPSFVVTPARGTWHCFGRCSRGGNAIDFVIEKEALTFWQALTLLGERGGVALPERSGEAGARGGDRARALEANDVARRFFERALWESREAEGARAYVERRGVFRETAERFSLGYAPRSGRYLREVLLRRGVPLRVAAVAGLVGTREEGGYFDRFRGRLMFPIRDALGRTLGFGGRALQDGVQPKYTNTQETELFRKRELLYGLFEGKQALRERREAAIAEGYLDVILAHQAGFPFVVATLGTAFGADHARTLRRLVDRVIALFDGDAAGRRANLRGIEELSQAVFRGARPFESLAVAALPEGLDPADVITERGAAAFARCLKEAQSLVDVLVPLEARRWDPARKVEAVERAARILAAFDQAPYREVQLAEVAHRLGVSEGLVREQARAARRPARRTGRAEAETAPSEERPAPLPALERALVRAVVARPELAPRTLEGLGALEGSGASGGEGSGAGGGLDPRAHAVVEALARGMDLREIPEAGARRLAARLAAEMAESAEGLDYESEWRGAMERLAQAGRLREAPLEDDDASLLAFQETYRELKAKTRIE